MAGLYFYVPTCKIQDITECGLKLSEWFDREVELTGQAGHKRAIRALINPWDDAIKARDEQFRAVRLEIDPDQCLIGDADLYQMGLKNPQIMHKYHETLIPLSRYCFGVFRNPECLIFTSILPDRIEVTGKVKDIPVLFESSESLYLGNIMENIEVKHQDSGNTLLYAYMAYLESKGLVEKLEDLDLGIALFMDPATRSYTVTKIPSPGGFDHFRKEASNIGE